MTDVMMQLGDYQFRLATAEYQRLERRRRQNKATLQRIGRKAASQHIGTELGTIKLSGHILPHWNGGWDQMNTLNTMANSGDPFQLVDWRGKNWGRWEIIEVGESESDHWGGAPMRIAFDITLQEYSEDGGSGFDLLSFGLSMAGRFL